jgi:hypothetical protein
MGKFILLLTLIGDLQSTPPGYRDALTQIRYGMLEDPSFKKELDEFQGRTEREFYHYTGLTKDQLVYGAYLYPVAAGKISSKPFKNFKYDTSWGFTFRPELEYKFADRDASAMLILVKEF